VDALEINTPLYFGNDLPLCRLGVNVWDRIEKSNDFGPSNVRLGNIRHMQEDIARLNTAKGDALRDMFISEERFTEKKKAHHQTDEKLKSIVFEVSYQPGAKPEHL
jgi:hypothetical protein